MAARTAESSCAPGPHPSARDGDSLRVSALLLLRPRPRASACWLPFPPVLPPRPGVPEEPQQDGRVKMDLSVMLEPGSPGANGLRLGEEGARSPWGAGGVRSAAEQ